MLVASEGSGLVTNYGRKLEAGGGSKLGSSVRNDLVSMRQKRPGSLIMLISWHAGATWLASRRCKRAGNLMMQRGWQPEEASDLTTWPYARAGHLVL